MKAYIEQAIRGIETEKEQKLREVEQRVVQEKILPFNREVDEVRDREIQKLTADYNEQLRVLQNKFESDKNAHIVASEERKKENASAVIAVETETVTAKYNKIIENLQLSLSAIEE